MKKELSSVVVTSSIEAGIRKRIEAPLQDVAEVVYLEDSDRESRRAILRDADVLLSFFFNKEIERGEYSLLENLRLLQTISTGVDYLPFTDIPRHVAIACNAGGWAYQIAEHVLSMTMALARHLVPLHMKLASGEFDQRSLFLRNLKGLTAGIIGYGGIGRHTAHLFKALGMKIMAINTSGKTTDSVDYVGTLHSLPHVLENADVVVLTLPLTKQTKNLIGREQLLIMKKDAILINVARAPLVVEKDLYEHLKLFPEFQAGLDVWWNEPTWGRGTFEINYPFFDLPNFLGSPHNSNNVIGAMADACQVAAENVALFLKGELWHGQINRADYVDMESLTDM